MKILRRIWPLFLIALLPLGSWGLWVAGPARRIDIVVVDKTVPFANRIEHRSLFWLLGHLKVHRADGVPYAADRDYLGAFPGPTPGDPPAWTSDLSAERAVRADLVYLVDTYGVYRDDLLSGPLMKAALERSPKIYGGIEPAEAEAAASALRAGKVLIAEFNTLGSPTGEDARGSLEDALGVDRTEWIGRYFVRLDDRSEVPEWMRRDYEREWKQPWAFKGPGFVLMQGDAHCEVLRVPEEVASIGLTLQKEAPVDPSLARARDGTAYPYWFDVVAARGGTRTLASFRWHATPAGEARLRARGLPSRFPAVTLRTAAGLGPAYYFAGDFADNPMDDGAIPFAGYPAVRRWMEAARFSPAEDSFYWRFYAPLMTRLLAQLPHQSR